MISCKLGFNVDHYDFELEFPDKLWENSSTSNFNTTRSKFIFQKYPFMALYKLGSVMDQYG